MADSRPFKSRNSYNQLTPGQKGAIRRRVTNPTVGRKIIYVSKEGGYTHQGIVWKNHQQRTAVLKRMGLFTPVSANRKSRPTGSRSFKSSLSPAIGSSGSSSFQSSSALSNNKISSNTRIKLEKNISGFASLAELIAQLTAGVEDTDAVINIVHRQYQIMEDRIFENSGSAPEFGVYTRWEPISPTTITGGSFTKGGKTYSWPGRTNESSRPLEDRGHLRQAVVNPSVERMKSQTGETATFTIKPSKFGGNDQSLLHNEGNAGAPFYTPAREFLPNPTPEFMEICALAISKHIHDPKAWDKISKSRPGAREIMSSPEVKAFERGRRNADYLKRKNAKKSAQRMAKRAAAGKKSRMSDAQAEERRLKNQAVRESQLPVHEQVVSFMESEHGYSKGGYGAAEHLGFIDPLTRRRDDAEYIFHEVNKSLKIYQETLKSLRQTRQTEIEMGRRLGPESPAHYEKLTRMYGEQQARLIWARAHFGAEFIKKQRERAKDIGTK